MFRTLSFRMCRDRRGVDLKTVQKEDYISETCLSPVEHTPTGSFRRVLKNRSFLLLWLAQLLSQSVFNAANYGVIAIVTAVTHSTVMVGVAIVTFTLPAVPFSLLAGVYRSEERRVGKECR